MSEEERITPVFFEQLLIKFLFTNEKVRDKTLPFLTPKIFENENNIAICEKILSFNERFNKFPSVQEMKVDLKNDIIYSHLVKIMNIDISQYDDTFILAEIEEFIRKQLVSNYNVEIASALNNNQTDKLQEYPDLMREAMAFSFNTEIGLEFFEEEDRMYNFLHNHDKVVPTDIKAFDFLVDGGMHEKSLTLWLAPTNLGKSLIMTSLSCNNILRNKNVLYITLEMSENKISERIMANMFNVAIPDLKIISKDRFHSIYEGIKKQHQNRLVVKEFPTRGANTNSYRNLLKELKVKKKFIPDIVYVDYIDIMLANNDKRSDNSYSELKRIAEELRGLAVETEIPWISATQVNRDGLTSSELDLGNMSESIGKAFTADLIIAVTQPDELKTAGKFKWDIIKNRYGIKKSVQVNVDYLKMRVYEDVDCKPEFSAKDTILQPQEKDSDIVEEISTPEQHKSKADTTITDFE